MKENQVRTLFIYFLLISLILGCETQVTSSNKKHSITIATAANVQFAMEELEIALEKALGINVSIVIGSSGKLTAQIKQGAPYDLFISANMKYPEKLYTDGFAATPPRVYALGSLVAWTMNKDLKLSEDLSVFTTNKIEKIGIANPKNAPYGAQAINAFKFFKIYEDILPKLVYGESIAQTNQYITTRNCEVGITAKSVVLAPEMKNKGIWVDVLPTAYEPIQQGMIITKYGQQENKDLAKAAYLFILSDEAALIFEKYGYEKFR